MSDQKIKTAAGKAPLGLVPARALVGAARVFQYGAKKYAAGNFHKATLDDGAGARYIGAALRHLAEMQEPNGLHTPASLAAIDPESGLPHLDHVLCGLMMLRSIMVKCGAIAVDPGEGKDPPSAEPVASTITSRPKCRIVDCVVVRPDGTETFIGECSGDTATCRCGSCVEFRTSTTCPLPVRLYDSEFHDPLPANDFADRARRYDY